MNLISAFKRKCLFTSFMLAGLGFFANAQETSVGLTPDMPYFFREQIVVVHIISRIIEPDNEVVWDMAKSSITLPGRPVGIQLIGPNLAMAVQFIPFLRPEGRHVLVAQGQIWISIPNEGVSYHTTVQTIPLEFMEIVYFMPLGSGRESGEAYIEIELSIEPYNENDFPELTDNNSE